MVVTISSDDYVAAHLKTIEAALSAGISAAISARAPSPLEFLSKFIASAADGWAAVGAEDPGTAPFLDPGPASFFHRRDAHFVNVVFKERTSGDGRLSRAHLPMALAKLGVAFEGEGQLDTLLHVLDITSTEPAAPVASADDTATGGSTGDAVEVEGAIGLSLEEFRRVLVNPEGFDPPAFRLHARRATSPELVSEGGACESLLWQFNPAPMEEWAHTLPLSQVTLRLDPSTPLPRPPAPPCHLCRALS